jgi:hypothetical protein
MVIPVTAFFPLFLSSFPYPLHYGHLIPEMQDDAAELIDALITPVEVKLHPNCTTAGVASNNTA